MKDIAFLDEKSEGKKKNYKNQKQKERGKNLRK
jgi:hypothetical protein